MVRWVSSAGAYTLKCAPVTCSEEFFPFFPLKQEEPERLPLKRGSFLVFCLVLLSKAS